MTIDVAFFDATAVASLEQLLERHAQERVQLYTSARPYAFDHQSKQFANLSHYLEQMKKLPETGADIPDDRVHFAVGKAIAGGFYQAKFSEDSLSRFQQFSTQLYGKWGYPLKPYEEYRVYSLFDHLNYGNQWFVTCDRKRLLGKHGRDVLGRWTIQACSPTDAVQLALDP